MFQHHGSHMEHRHRHLRAHSLGSTVVEDRRRQIGSFGYELSVFCYLDWLLSFSVLLPGFEVQFALGSA